MDRRIGETVAGLSDALSEREITALKADAADAQRIHEDILTEPCDGGNEWHCSCVPYLRAEVERLKAELDDIQQTHAEVMDESCDAGDERHCSCVPHLRREVKRQVAARKDAKRLRALFVRDPNAERDILDDLHVAAALLERHSGEIGFALAGILRKWRTRASEALKEGENG